MNDRVLITGGAGYIGTTLVPVLLDMGYDVTVVDNLMYRQTTLTTHCFNPKFKFVKGDVRDYDLIDPLIKEHDIIIPLACIVGMPACKKDERAAVQVNEDAVKHIADIVGNNKKIIFPTTNISLTKLTVNHSSLAVSFVIILPNFAIVFITIFIVDINAVGVLHF